MKSITNILAIVAIASALAACSSNSLPRGGTEEFARFDKAMVPQIMQHQGRITDPAVIEQIVGSKNPWTQGYAYQMWCCADGAIRLDGAWGQLSIIFPEQNAVVTTTAHTNNVARLMESIWKNILPLLNDN